MGKHGEPTLLDKRKERLQEIRQWIYDRLPTYPEFVTVHQLETSLTDEDYEFLEHRPLVIGPNLTEMRKVGSGFRIKVRFIQVGEKKVFRNVYKIMKRGYCKRPETTRNKTAGHS